MNGELLMKGYKFPEKLMLNLQDKTVLTGEDTFLAFEIFNMLENYFNRKAFSDYYLDKGTILILNGNKLSGSEFAVFRIHPIVNLADELKISKKSILGQAIQASFEDNTESMSKLMDSIQTNVLSHLNAITEGYRVSFSCEEADIFTIAKILQPAVKETGGQDILQQEHDQFYCKSMMLDFVGRLKTNKKKLLLVELPEYGLKQEEVNDFFNMLSRVIVDNVVVYTHKIEICNAIPNIFNYNVTKNNRLYGFDDYDLLETQLQNAFTNKSVREIEEEVLKYIFNSYSNWQKQDKFAQIIDEFLN